MLLQTIKVTGLGEYLLQFRELQRKRETRVKIPLGTETVAKSGQNKYHAMEIYNSEFIKITMKNVFLIR